MRVVDNTWKTRTDPEPCPGSLCLCAKVPDHIRDYSSAQWPCLLVLGEDCPQWLQEAVAMKEI